jgi:hypothetical protein
MAAVSAGSTPVSEDDVRARIGQVFADGEAVVRDPWGNLLVLYGRL